MTTTDREYSAQCEFSRHIVDRLLQWFTAFMAVNMLAIGWVVTKDWQGGAAIWMVAVYMVVQDLLGVLAVLRTRRELSGIAVRVAQLLTPEEELPIPKNLYASATGLMRDALATTAVAWVVIPLVRIL